MYPKTQFAVLDVETTGLFPNASDRILELAVVRVDARGNKLDEYVTLVNPQRDVGPIHIHGITAREVKNAPAFEEIAGDVLARLAGAIFVAHNVHFDMRFLQAEMSRAACELPVFPFLCTMQLARKVDRNVPSRKLETLCQHFGITYTKPHMAHLDALATAGLLAACIARLERTTKPDLATLGVQGELLAKRAWPSIPVSGKSLCREAAAERQASEPSFIARLIAKLPPEKDTRPELDAYLALLDRVLEDRRVTADEANAMLLLAQALGISRAQAVRANEAYMQALIRIALQDNVITKAEKNDLEEVRRLLWISPAVYQRLLKEQRKERPRPHPGAEARLTASQEIQGRSVCFTGTLACRIRGELITRAMAQRIARDKGMKVLSNVTKTLDYLVTADPDSMSGKAKKARDYGVRIIAEPVFWQMLGLAVE